MRILWIFLILALLALVPFLIWGERFGEIFTKEGSISWLQEYGRWAWAAGIVLLVLDLFLPLPSTVVMSALGFVYGVFRGGFLAAAGSFLAGAAAYELCRLMGHRAALWIAGEKGLREGEAVFAEAGGWLVALSRCLPILPEVIACLAGLTRMSRKTFYAALGCGCLPVGFVFAAVGQGGNEHPLAAIFLSIVLPVIFWAVVRPIMKRKRDAAIDS